MLAPPAIRFLAPLAYLGTLVAAGCGTAADRPDSLASGGSVDIPAGPGATGETPAGKDDVASGSCQLAESRDCLVQLPAVQGIKNCFVGTQVCVNESWSDCVSDADAAELLAP
jgi:hypothetical protein